MPRGDGTGPTGAGPMTGRAVGFCAGYATPGYMNPLSGRGYWGWGRGRGGGFGRPNRFFAAVPTLMYPPWTGAATPNVPAVPAITPEQELEGLKRHAEFLQNSLGQVNQRIEQLQTDSTR